MSPRTFGQILGWVLVILAATFVVAVLVAAVRWAVGL